MENISTVKVTLNETMENLKLLTSYLAGQREESAAAYDKVAALDTDAAVVAVLMEDAALRISSLFPANLIRWRYAPSSSTLPGSSTTTDGNTPATDSPALSGALEFTLKRVTDPVALQVVLAKAVTQEVLRRWLRLSGSDYADALALPGEELTLALSAYLSPLPGVRASSRPLPPI